MKSGAKLATLVIFAISLLALVGWMLDIAFLKSVSPQWITMRVTTAICLLLLAIELAVVQKKPSKDRSLLVLHFPVVLVGMMGLLLVALYVLTMITGMEPSAANGSFIDLLFSPSNRPALLTAILFVLSSSSLLLLASGGRGTAAIAHAVILPAAIVSYLVPVSYLLDVQAMTGWLNIPVALNTGIAFCAVCVAILCLRPDTWLMSVLTGDGAGSAMARRLLPAFLVIPLLIGRLRLVGERAGAFASDVGVALVAITYTVCLLWLVWLSARSVNRADEKRREMENALQEREEILRLFVRHAPAAVAMFDREMRYLAHSERWCQDYALGPGEILGRSHYDVFPEMEDRWKAVYRRCLQGASEEREEDQFARPDGRIEWIRWEVHPWRTGNQQIGGLIIFSEVTTERKCAERSLEQQRSLLKAIFESAQGPVFSVDRNYCYTSFNRQHAEVMKALFGANIEIGHNLLDYHTVARDRDEARKNLDRALRGDPIKLETIVGQEGMSQRYFEISHNPVRDASGNIIGVAVFALDLTERKQAEIALLQAKEEWERTFESVPDLIAILDGQFRIVRMNKAMQVRLAGFANACGGFRCYERVHGTNTPPAFCPHVQTMADGLEHMAEVHEDRLGGDFLVSTTPISDAQGRMIGAVHVARDITARKRAEEALRQARDELDIRVRERTSELSQTVATLHGEVSERIFTEKALRERSAQLQLLAAQLTLAEQRERQRLAHVLHDGLQQILVAAKFRLALVDRNQDVRRTAAEVADLIDDAIETSRSLTAELSPPILHQGGLVSGLEWLVRWMLEKHGMHVSLQVSTPIQAVPEEVMVLLFQATRELLFNVVKHAGVKAASVAVMQQEDRIEIAVNDEGAGFDPSQLRAQGGSAGGIGLFSIRERLTLLGGMMDIDSAPGAGSRFRLVSPDLASVEESGCMLSDHEPRVSIVMSGRREPGTAGSSKKIRVLLADDHIVMRQGLAGLLRIMPDIEIVGEASDGESAVNLTRQIRPDVVLMDISMPGMDGVQATRIIHAELPEVRIIGLSMFEEGEQAIAMREAGAHGYQTKSGPSEDLIAAIRSCIRPAEKKSLKQSAS